MARSKVKLEWDNDRFGNYALKATCTRGKLNNRDVYEVLEHNYPGCLFVHLVPIPEDTPTELYDEGDEWWLYEPYDIIKELLDYTGGYYKGKERS